MSRSRVQFKPPATPHPVPKRQGLTPVSRYRRRMPVSLARMYENALDWAHLPYLHAGSFTRIHCHAAGDLGWRADAVLAKPQAEQLPSNVVWLKAVALAAISEPLRLARYLRSLQTQTKALNEGAAVTLNLQLDTEAQQWVTTTVAGPGAGSEVWTQVIEHGEQDIEVIVDFLVPGAPRALAKPVGQYYRALYAALYDEDEAMMRGRQRALAQRYSQQLGSSAKRSESLLSLGLLSELQENLPKQIAFKGQTWRLVTLANGDLGIHASLCPHMLGPLTDAQLQDDDSIICPWHGYRFSVVSGECFNAVDCRLPTAPSISIDDDGEVWLS